MVLTTEQKEKNRQYSKSYYENENNKNNHADYMKSYHKNNTQLLKDYKKLMKDKVI